MAKKEDLMNGFGQRINKGAAPAAKEPEPGTVPSPKINPQEAERRSRVGRKKSWDTSPRLTDSYNYTSLALNEEIYKKIREIAVRNALPIRDIVNAALSKYVELYEAKHGPITPSRESHISADSLV